MAEIEKFHFRTNYQVIVDPEFPGDGNWRCPVVGYDRDAAVVDRFEPRWGTPLVLEVEPMAGDRWVGMFEASGLGGTTGVFATPNSARLCAVVDGLAYVVKADDFEDVAAVKWQVHQVMAVEDSPVLLLVSGIDITALPKLVPQDLQLCLRFYSRVRPSCSARSPMRPDGLGRNLEAGSPGLR